MHHALSKEKIKCYPLQSTQEFVSTWSCFLKVLQKISIKIKQ